MVKKYDGPGIPFNERTLLRRLIDRKRRERLAAEARLEREVTHTARMSTWAA